MGMNGEGVAAVMTKITVVLDIETASIANAADYLEPATAPSTYKDPAKIAAYIENASAAQLAKAALDPDLARVVAVGLGSVGGVEVLTAGDEEEERALLEGVWAAVSGTTVIGYNVVGFDLPVLLRRSFYLNVKAPDIQLDRFRHPTVIDLMQVLSFNGAQKFRRLSFYAKRLGFEIEDGVTGADVPGLVASGNINAVVQHVTSDVKLTMQIAQRMGVL
tara:strand:+ start:1051 stop:1707 length:657 start_codon:yes stop_codon:yes gene_type:complete